AGELQRGVSLLFEAAESAAGTDMRAALRLLLLRDDALADLDGNHAGRIDGWLLASRVARAASRPAEGLDWGRKALELARFHQDREAIVRALQCICSCQRLLGEIDEARRAIENALHLSDGLPPMLRAETLYQCAAVMLDTGEIRGCERTVRRAMQLPQEVTRRVRSGALLGYVMALQGDMEGALTTLHELLPVAEGSGDRGSISDLHNVLGEVERIRGREERAEGHYRKALEVLAGTGIVAPACRANLAQTLLARGDVREAKTMLDRVSQEAHEIGARMLILVAHAGLVACAADMRSWGAMDANLQALEDDRGGLATEDIATCLRYAGTHAMVLEKGELGRRALVLAAAQFEQLGRREEAADLRELL
ncbi:MAG: tetratricopeptide repeat protein, partial [Myxococcales bacterium]|nr:tetratricopeptide repeat protein [Myxococcales bacterium]